MRRKEVIAKLEEVVEFTEWEKAIAGKRQTERWRGYLLHTADAVAAGFMTKDRGKWSITNEGRAALGLGEDGLLDAAREAYSAEKRANKASDSDGEEQAVRGKGSEQRAQIFKAGLGILARSPNGSMPVDDFLRALPSELSEELVEALEERRSDWVENYGYQTFYRAARIKWIDRRSGTWTLKPKGQKALEEYPDAMVLWETARKFSKQEPGLEEKLPYLGTVEDFSGLPPALYRSNSATVGQLVSDIQQGTLALPDIQRPFVWKNTKVRDLLDSMFRGFPFGYILTWKNPTETKIRRIGEDEKGTELPHALVIDGQQRLTSLYTVMTGEAVLDANFRKRQIRIAFHPIQASFEVADAALERSPEWIHDISDIFTEPMGAMAVARGYLEKLEAAREIKDQHRRAAEQNIQRLVNLKNTQLGVLEIGLEADEEQVAEIFVRINSKGQNLRQADFILTLLAVFWEEGREQLEDFARACRVPSASREASPFNRQLQPGADDMVRVVVAFSHRRARLSAAYQVLRGKDAEKGIVTEEARDKNLALLQVAQERVLDAGNWHEFLKVLSAAGYRNARQIQSMNTALYTYAFFLLGRETYGVQLQELRALIARWFTLCAIKGRYVGGASESRMDEDLARLRGLEEGDAAGFTKALEGVMAAELTNDYWALTMPARLESSSVRSASAYFAAQCVLGSKALWSELPVSELFDPQKISTREDLEIHHLYPKAWLKKNGFDSVRQYNQIANYALLEWSDNSLVADRSPAEYAPEMDARVPAEDHEAMREAHALPERWWELEYPEFLAQRRVLMASVIRAAFERLSAGRG